jgi:hypothetical protein
VSFRTQGRVDVEPPSGAECAMASPRVWQAAVDVDQGAEESMRMWSTRMMAVEVDADGVGAADGATMSTRA